MRLAVIIVNYNVKHFLEQCLRSALDAAQGLDVEIWVVDNNSVDGSVQIIKDRFPQVRLIANKENLGFSKANNQAIKQSQADYKLLLNPDTVVPEDCFKTLIDFMDSHPEAGACGLRMVDGQGSFLPESKRGLPTPEVALYKMVGLNKLFPRSKRFGKYHLGYLNENEVHEVEVLAGACMMLRQEALDKAGLLDETFFMYGEDIDLSYRITQVGYKNYYVPTTSIIHYKGESTKKQSVNYVRIFYKAMIIFAEKHYSGGAKRWFIQLINLAIYLRAGLSLVSRFVKSHGLKILETAIIFLSLLFLVDYWEEHIKYIKSYPAEMRSIHLPYYTLSWLVALMLSGSYTNIYDLRKLMRGMAVGTGVILIIYGLLPNHLHFSRGIILFGTLAVTAALIIERALFHYLKYRRLDFKGSGMTRSLLVGNSSSWEKIREMMQNSADYEQIGYLSDAEADRAKSLGTVSQLAEVVKIFKVNEIIFSADSINTEDTMQWMSVIGPEVQYFIVPKESDFAIGSHSKNSNGLYMGQQIALRLSQPEWKRRKRLFDLLSALTLFILLPLSAMLFNYKGFYHDLSAIIKGKKTWISYSSEGAQLPPLKAGVFSTDSGSIAQSASQRLQLDMLYARHYDVATDLSLLWKGLRKKR